MWGIVFPPDGIRIQHRGRHVVVSRAKSSYVAWFHRVVEEALLNGISVEKEAASCR